MVSLVKRLGRKGFNGICEGRAAKMDWKEGASVFGKSRGTTRLLLIPIIMRLGHGTG